jgi:uncharacterized membrane protein
MTDARSRHLEAVLAVTLADARRKIRQYRNGYLVTIERREIVELIDALEAVRPGLIDQAADELKRQASA